MGHNLTIARFPIQGLILDGGHRSEFRTYGLDHGKPIIKLVGVARDFARKGGFGSFC